ncbi:MAG: DUF3820 family protein [Pseudomonadota bacterium]|jgi:hypothetical protein|nr:DUF3820 family protein [Pseudomonadota bacterium]
MRHYTLKQDLSMSNRALPTEPPKPVPERKPFTGPLPFGQFKGRTLREIPESYLFWLCSRGKSTYYRSKHSLDVTWKVPFEIWEAARAEAERRGFVRIGERWEPK